MNAHDGAVLIDIPVILLDQNAGVNAGLVSDRPRRDRRDIQADGLCQSHAECFAGNQPGKPLWLRLDNVRAGCVTQWQTNGGTVNDDRQLGLRSGQRKPQTLGARPQRQARQFEDDILQLAFY